MNYAISNRFTFNWIDFIRIVGEVRAACISAAAADGSHFHCTLPAANIKVKKFPREQRKNHLRLLSIACSQCKTNRWVNLWVCGAACARKSTKNRKENREKVSKKYIRFNLSNRNHKIGFSHCENQHSKLVFDYTCWFSSSTPPPYPPFLPYRVLVYFIPIAVIITPFVAIRISLFSVIIDSFVRSCHFRSRSAVTVPVARWVRVWALFLASQWIWMYVLVIWGTEMCWGMERTLIFIYLAADGIHIYWPLG